ncbi:MAG: aminotransferase class I/II-fold pyridoxal phosphate-dependent enzyme [Alphaproteobacteria bacterium]
MLSGHRVADRAVLDRIRDHPFTRLNRLLADVPAAAGHEPSILSIGEPRRTPPRFIADAMAAHFDDWSRYPLPAGIPELRHACADWMTTRYRLPAGMIDPDRHVMAVPGTREPLYLAIQLIADRALVPSGPPLALMPDPAYHAYRAATIMAGAEPVHVPARPEHGFMPDYAALSPDILDRAAVAYLCSPCNPQGAAADLDRWIALVELAQRHNFVLLADEVYSELYAADGRPPAGVAEACAVVNPDMRNVLIFQSLSKRSNAAGMRSGFVAGDADLVGPFTFLRNYAGTPVPIPLQHAAVALWRDEAHVDDNRRFYDANFALARAVFGNAAGPRPDGGFFLWLDVGDGEAFAARAWREAAVKVLPGGYMAFGDDPDGSIARRYARLALVDPPQKLEPALQRLARLMDRT